MKASAGANRRRRLAAAAALSCALVVSLAVAVAPACAFPEITGPEAPEEYPHQYEGLDPEIVARQVSDREVVFEYLEPRAIAWSVQADPASDADGATVPTSLKLSEDEKGPVITEIVHYRAGNPAAGGAPFVVPIVAGSGWEGGFRTYEVKMPPPESQAEAPPPPPAPAPVCEVPPLRGLALRATEAHLRRADCAIGDVHLARGATRGKGKVVKQFRPAGTRLPAGAPVAVKLGAR